jgi:MYXO-CTERM domain-containing protein
MRLAKYSLLLSVSLALAIPSSVEAYQFRHCDSGAALIWGARDVTVEIEAAPKSLPGAEDAVRAGFATWLSSGVPMTVDFKSSSSQRGVGHDGHNTVSFQTQNWEYGDSALALTIATYEKNTGRVVETDMVFNMVSVKWSTNGKSPVRFDLQNVATHEAGHFFGLGHSHDVEATMFASTPAGEQSKRLLHTDDRDGIVALIGKMEQRLGQWAPPLPEVPRREPVIQHNPQVVERAAAGCSVGAAGSGGAVFWSVLVLFFLLRRRLLGVVSAVVVLMALPQPAEATHLVELDLTQLTARSSVIMHAKVSTRRALWHRGIVFTEYKLQLRSCLKGDARDGSCVTTRYLRVPGGEIGKIGMHVPGAPTLSPGEEIVVFARKTSTSSILALTGLGQGLYRVDKTAAGQLVAKQDLRKVILHQAGGAKSHGILKTVPLQSLLTTIRRTVSH